MTTPARSPNTTRTSGRVARADRERLLGQRGCVVWLTGLSGSGKSTLAQRLERRLVDAGRLAFVLDGDNLRHGLCGDLGFAPEDRTENIRRAGEVAALLAEVGAVVLAAFISPYRADRQRVRQTVGDVRFLEVHVDAPLAVCEARDPKGLYRKARAGEIPEFTGIDAPYEPPEAPAVRVDTGALGIDEAAAAIERVLLAGGFLPAPASGGGQP
jgi:adenylyl-sulfate kinase